MMIECSKNSTHGLERLLAIHKVQSTEDESSITILVALVPTFGQQVPFGLELLTKRTSESGFQCGQEDGDRVVTGSLGEVCVEVVIQLD